MDDDTWRSAGLWDPDAPEADERRALLEYLSARGATLEQMAVAHRLGSLPGVAGELVIGIGTQPAILSLEEVAARYGIPVERVQRVLLAVGLPVGADTKVPEGLGSLMVAFEQGVALMGEEAILAFTRVLGAAAIMSLKPQWPCSTPSWVPEPGVKDRTSWPGPGCRKRPRLPSPRSPRR